MTLTMSILLPSGVRFLSRAAALTVSYHHNRGLKARFSTRPPITPAGSELCLQLAGAVAFGTSPRLGAVPVAAIAPCMRILDGQQLEVFLPIGPFFGHENR